MFLLTGLTSLSAVGIMTTASKKTTNNEPNGNDGRIYGTVYRNGEGIEGVTLILERPIGYYRDSTVTDSTGFYQFTNVFYLPNIGTSYCIRAIGAIPPWIYAVLDKDHTDIVADYHILYLNYKECNTPFLREKLNPLFIRIIEKAPFLRTLLKL